VLSLNCRLTAGEGTDGLAKLRRVGRRKGYYLRVGEKEEDY